MLCSEAEVSLVFTATHTVAVAHARQLKQATANGDAFSHDAGPKATTRIMGGPFSTPLFACKRGTLGYLFYGLELTQVATGTLR